MIAERRSRGHCAVMWREILYLYTVGEVAVGYVFKLENFVLVFFASGQTDSAAAHFSRVAYLAANTATAAVFGAARTRQYELYFSLFCKPLTLKRVLAGMGRGEASLLGLPGS